jgi:hypothetical protein
MLIQNIPYQTLLERPHYSKQAIQQKRSQRREQKRIALKCLEAFVTYRFTSTCSVQRFGRQHAAGVVEWKAHIALGALVPLLYTSPYELVHTVWGTLHFGSLPHIAGLAPPLGTQHRKAGIRAHVCHVLASCLVLTYGPKRCAHSAGPLLHRFTIIAAAYPAHGSACPQFLVEET